VPSLLSNALVVFLAIFLAELPDKTMFATLMLATRMRRPFAVWVGVSIAYCTHVVIAVLFGSALSKLPERPIHLLVGLVFLVAGVVMFRSSNLERQETQEIHQTRNFFKVVYLSMSAILVAEFADLTQLATVGFTVRMNDSVGVAIGAASALCSVSAIAVLAGSALQKRFNLLMIQRVASVFFILFGISAIVNSIF
jgi:Ca2+/H+ antiporter, TMEM165/GDT1 family